MNETVRDQDIAAERQEAARLLLRSPLILAERDRDAFAGIRRQEEFLRPWFQHWFGYRLVVDRDFARLHKVAPANADPTRPARRRSGSAFDRRRYVLLCLLLAALDRGEAQAVLSDLSEAVRELAQVEGLPAPDFDRHPERRAFVDAARLLTELGVLRQLDGDDTAFLDGNGDVLYDVDLRILAHLLSAGWNPRCGPGDPVGEVTVYPDNQDGVNQRVRHGLMRHLAEDPVLYLNDLDEQEIAYMTSQRPAFRRELRSILGLRMELREEGVATLDAENELSDLGFPAHNMVAHAALLLAGRLAYRAGEEGTDHDQVFSDADVTREVEALIGARRKYFSDQYRNGADGARRMADEALALLESFGLAARTASGVRVRPAANRYAATDANEVQTSWMI
jgi:uncharacterized protein (TIGR02678 family)